LWQERTNPHTRTTYGDTCATDTYAYPYPADGHTDARPSYSNIHTRPPYPNIPTRPAHTYPSAVGPGSDNRIH
jgi:hypothetical protein